MGALISFTPVKVTLRRARGVYVSPSCVAPVYRLAIPPQCPLYPVVQRRVDPKQFTMALDDGCYEASWGTWFRVQRGEVEFINEVEMLKALGAPRHLDALGLGDAAVSLEQGELTLARYQWIRARDGA